MNRTQLLMLRLVGATLVVAPVGCGWLNARCRLGAHKGRPYTIALVQMRNVIQLIKREDVTEGWESGGEAFWIGVAQFCEAIQQGG